MYHGTPAETASALRQQLAYFANNFCIVPLPQLVDHLSRDHDFGSNEVALTFDDGLRNNLTVAYPILQELRLPATFFVCPALIDSGSWLWNHEARCRLQYLSDSARSNLQRRFPAWCSSPEMVVSWMKSLYLKGRSEIEDAIREATSDYAPSADQKHAYDMMDWKDLRSVEPELITIGSHSLSHPILTTLDRQELIQEVEKSRDLLEQRLQRNVELFCYPNGAHDSRVRKEVKNMYRAAVTTESRVIEKGDSIDPYLLPRIPTANDAALMAWRLHRPGA